MEKQVRIKTNYGTMTATLYADKVGETVANFLQYAEKGFYNNTLFHRVIPNFMIQGGGIEPGMYLKATDPAIKNEACAELKNSKFTLAMARTPDPHSATSQFFINVNDNHFLDWSAPTEEGFGYCVFGHLTEGLDVAMTISEVATGERAGYADVPEQDVVIEEVEVVTEEGEAAESETAAETQAAAESSAKESDNASG